MVTPNLVWDNVNITPYSNNPTNRTDESHVTHYATLVLEGADDDYYPTIFRDTRGRQENNCLHAKPVAFPHSSRAVYSTINNSGLYRFDGFYESLQRQTKYGYGGIIAWQAFPSYTLVVSVNGTEKYKSSNIRVYFITSERYGSPGSYRYDAYYSLVEWDRPSPDSPGWQMRYNNEEWFQASAPWPYFTDDEVTRADSNPLGCLHKAESFAISMVSTMRLWSHILLERRINTRSPYQNVETPSLSHPFILGEEEIFDGLLSSEPGANYARNWLVQHAYKDALDNMPTLSDNTISNIFEFGQLIVSIISGGGMQIPKNLSSAWLSYRYQYNTTKADLQEAAEFINRKIDLEKLRQGIKTYGQSSYTFKGTTITCRCRISLKLKYIDAISDLASQLYMYGLMPDFYILWDMTPFSFVADWFLPIGDILSILDKESAYSPWTYDISSVTMSLSYQKDDHKCYSRFETGPINLNGFYWFDRPQTSDRVRLFRILDGASLIVH